MQDALVGQLLGSQQPLAVVTTCAAPAMEIQDQESERRQLTISNIWKSYLADKPTLSLLFTLAMGLHQMGSLCWEDPRDHTIGVMVAITLGPIVLLP